MFESSLISCLSPTPNLYAVKGQPLFFPCGHCPACLKSKQNSWQERLYHHITCGQFYTVFITLVYDNDNLPYVDISEGYPIFSRTKFRRDGSFYRCIEDIDLDDWYDFVCDHDLFIPHFVNLNHNGVQYFNEEQKFAVVCKKDIQDFIKRLRTSIHRDPMLSYSDHEVTYFICSEYGPKTYRPHYHGLLFFRDKSVADWAVSHGVFESWRKQSLPRNSFGDSIASHVNNSRASASYVSKYVTNDDMLPCLLNFASFKNFHLQSISTPIGSLCTSLDNVPNLLSQGNISFPTIYRDKVTKEEFTVYHSLPASFWRKIFPTSLCSCLLDDSQLLRVIRRVFDFRSVDDFPDYRQLIQSYYSVGEVVMSLPDRISIGTFTTKLWQKCLLSAGYDCVVGPSLPVSSVKAYKISPSFACYSLISSSYYFDVDLYLFGFDKNRSFARKLLSLRDSCSWLTSAEIYVRYRNQYLARKFSDSYKSIVDFQNEHLNSFDYVYRYTDGDLFNHDYYNRYRDLHFRSKTFYNKRLDFTKSRDIF